MPYDVHENGKNGNFRTIARHIDTDNLEESVEEKPTATCACHDNDYPPFTGEIHGLSQALLSKSPKLRIFWWLVLFVCTSCGTATTVLVIIEYIQGPTATSTTIKLVPSLELPAITVCPKVPDAFDFDKIYNDIKGLLPELNKESAADLLRFWLGGSGLENITPLTDFNRTYLDQLAQWYNVWSNNHDPKSFFDLMQQKYGYKCSDLFHYCELAGKAKDCCDDLFNPRSVMRRGLCYQTRRFVNQTESDDVGRLVLRIKAPSSVTSPHYNFTQPQIIIYINDNFDHVLDFPRFYLYKDEWNRMHFTARYVELLDHPEDCSTKIVGKDTVCFLRNWLNANLIDPFNCTVPYLMDIPGVPNYNVCEPAVIVNDYYNTIEIVHSGAVHSQECIPGCVRWDYGVSLQQSVALEPFIGFKFNLEASFYDLQYEHVKEVLTTSVPGFMSQIGGQFGFFLGLSIITMLQIVIYGVGAIGRFFYRLFRPLPIEPDESELPPPGRYHKQFNEDNMATTWITKLAQLNRVKICTDLLVDLMIAGHIYWWFSRIPKKGGMSESSSNATTNGGSVEINKDGSKNFQDEFEWEEECTCHDNDYPPWTAEVHGLSQALMSKSPQLKLFWWFILLACTSCGISTTILVIKEYLRFQTATSTTIKLVNSLELPAMTICPKVGDSFRYNEIYADMRETIGHLDNSTAMDVLRFWLGGSGFENIEHLKSFNRSYMDKLNGLYKQWMNGYDRKDFFDMIVSRYGYKCQDLFSYCELGGKQKECCDDLFRPRAVIRRGLCYQTKRNVNQTESDDTGKLVVLLRSPPSITSPQYSYRQPQIIVYINDNFDQVLDYPRYYLYPDQWNRIHFTARYVEMLDEHPVDCSTKIIGKDSSCFVRNWITTNLIEPFNCTLPYLTEIPGLPELNICDPYLVARDYYNTIEVIHSGSALNQQCVPGCKRWEYQISMQQSTALENFDQYRFNLEVSFYDLQFEHVKEVATSSVPAFLSKIGGQFGFFLGLSIITMIQIVIYAASAILKFVYKFFMPIPVHSDNSYRMQHYKH